MVDFQTPEIWSTGAFVYCYLLYIFYLKTQFGLLVLQLGEKSNQFSDVLEMEEVVLPFEWHSFCISINTGLKQAAVFHNGHIQAIQLFKKLNDGTEDKTKFMTSGHLGGAKFVGTIIDFEVFGRPLPDDDLLKWTLCQNKGSSSF